LILNKIFVIENEDGYETVTQGVDICRLIGYVYFRSQLMPMCGPAFEYTFEDFLNDASQEEWDEWESKAAELELPLDYYLQEFVACAS
jgi:hypothetical protein